MAPPDDGRLAGNLAPVPALIRCYEAIAATSRLMLAAAHDDDWDEVARLEERCREQIARLTKVARSQPLGAAEQRRRIELLRAILANDAQVRRRAEPWLQQLERMIEPRRAGGTDSRRS
ncbi:MAG TPA: flagellar protein FliT [Burkholderiaceae bacterium]|nr:flagellar protein FliT [Burkholderiaceae bacterium]